MAKDLLFDHIVVLMLENRSFDHVFGFLGKGEGVPPDAVQYLKPGDATSKAFRIQRGGDFTAVGQGPSHSFKQTNEQLFGKTNVAPDIPANQATLNGFVSSFEVSLKYDLHREPTDSELQQVMNVFDPVQLPVLSTLAQEYVLCDHWFADLPGPTMPNRAFVHAATSQGYTDNAGWKPEFHCDTIYDRLNAKGQSWRVYYHDQNDVLQLFPYVHMSVENNVHFESSFFNDVMGDKLATYSFIDPAFMSSPQHQVNSMHAPADVRPAEKLVADVYNALCSNVEVFKKTLLVIVFDEHGGYYDHVQPPAAVPPDAIAAHVEHSYLLPFNFDRLGLRVPCILVSPWFEAGVDPTPYSHSSIPGSIIEAFGLGAFLTQRDTKAAKLTDKYLDKTAMTKAGKALVWRTPPAVNVPVQPDRIDATQREILEGSVHRDPHVNLRDPIRTHDIVDSDAAGHFVQTQVAKQIEHRAAAKRLGQSPAGAPAGAAPDAHLDATAAVSPARIFQLQHTSGRPPQRRP